MLVCDISLGYQRSRSHPRNVISDLVSERKKKLYTFAGRNFFLVTLPRNKWRTSERRKKERGRPLLDVVVEDAGLLCSTRVAEDEMKAKKHDNREMKMK